MILTKFRQMFITHYNTFQQVIGTFTEEVAKLKVKKRQTCP